MTLPVVQCCADGVGEALTADEAAELATLLKATANSSRLRILSMVAQAGEACVCNLSEPLGVSQPTVSHHLKVLTEAGLLNREQRGTWAWYSINQERMRQLGAVFAVR